MPPSLDSTFVEFLIIFLKFSSMNVADELEKLQQLHQSGGISDDEFAKAKAKLLSRRH